MSNDAAPERTCDRRRGWFQFSLRTALWMMVVLAVAFGWLGDRAKLERQLAAERAEKEGLRAARDYGETTADVFGPFGGYMASSTGSWQLLATVGESDEATVEHIKEHLSGEPCYVVSRSMPWAIRGGSTVSILGDSVFWDSGTAFTSSGIDLTLTNPKVVQDVAPKDGTSLSTLIKLLGDSDATMRARAACTLARLGPNAKDAVPALVERLKDADAAVRFHAAYALGRIRENSPAVVTALREAMEDDGSATAAFAAQMLHRIDPSIDIVPRLIALLGHRHAETRRRAIVALMAVHSQQSGASNGGASNGAPSSGAATTEAADALPRLKKLVVDSDPETCKQAMIAVARIASPVDAHAILGEVVKAGPGADKELWTFASLLWNKLDRQVRAAQATEDPGK